jgi:hypothetical protein
MKTTIIQLNNSDNVLSQARWSRLCGEIRDTLKTHQALVHFYGFSQPDSFAQKACWIFRCDDDENYNAIKSSVSAFVKAQKSEQTYWYEGDFLMTPAHLLS